MQETCQKCSQMAIISWKGTILCHTCLQNTLEREEGIRVKEIKKMQSERFGGEIIVVLTHDGDAFKMDYKQERK